MPDVTQQLRAELRHAAASRPVDDPAAYGRIVRRVAWRRAATRVGAVTALAIAFAFALAAPRLLGATIGGPDLARPAGDDRSGGPYSPPCDPSLDSGGLWTPAAGGDSPVLRAGTCKQPAFQVAPVSTTAGATVEVSGSCQAVLGGRASSVVVLLSLSRSKQYTGVVRPDGRFELRLELPWRLLPARYQVTASCVAEGGQAGITGAALLGDRLLDVARPDDTASDRGDPRPDDLTASLDRQLPGPAVRLRGGNCYLSRLGGVPGLVQIAIAPSVEPAGNPGSIPADSYDALSVEPGRDGSWTAVVRPPVSPNPGRSFDIYTFCTDDLGSLGFMYRPVYRVDYGASLTIRLAPGAPEEA